MTTRRNTKPVLQQSAERILEEVLRSSRRFPALRPALRRLVSLNGLRAGLKADVSLVGSAEMTKLNAKYRGKRRPTDVLSFPAPPVFSRQGHLGELIICPTVARRQAREHRHSIDEEFFVLITHGVLHLLGFDHEAGGVKARRMAALEAELLAAWLPSLSGLIHRVNAKKTTVKSPTTGATRLSRASGRKRRTKVAR